MNMHSRGPDGLDSMGSPAAAACCELVLFARSPAQQAKSRLAPLLGDEGALAAHIELVEHTIANLQGLNHRHAITGMRNPELSLWTTQQCSRVESWADSLAAPVMLQQGESLGARMLHALVCCSRRSDRVCLVGTDCPELDSAYVQQAFAALAHHDVVLGPVEDGGYVLIGIRSEHGSHITPMFSDIPFGTAQVAELTRERAQAQGFDVGLLPTLWDVDTPDDWRRYQRWRV